MSANTIKIWLQINIIEMLSSDELTTDILIELKFLNDILPQQYHSYFVDEINSLHSWFDNQDSRYQLNDAQRKTIYLNGVNKKNYLKDVRERYLVAFLACRACEPKVNLIRSLYFFICLRLVNLTDYESRIKTTLDECRFLTSKIRGFLVPLLPDIDKYQGLEDVVIYLEDSQNNDNYLIWQEQDSKSLTNFSNKLIKKNQSSSGTLHLNIDEHVLVNKKISDHLYELILPIEYYFKNSSGITHKNNENETVIEGSEVLDDVTGDTVSTLGYVNEDKSNISNFEPQEVQFDEEESYDLVKFKKPSNYYLDIIKAEQQLNSQHRNSLSQVTHVNVAHANEINILLKYIIDNLIKLDFDLIFDDSINLSPSTFSIEQQTSLYLLMILMTGMESINESNSFKLRHHSYQSEITFKPTRSQVSDDWDTTLCSDIQEHLYLFLPKLIGEIHIGMFSNTHDSVIDEIKEYTKSYLRKINKYYDTRLTLNKIEKYITHFLSQNGFDNAVIDILTGKTIKHTSALPYFNVSQLDLYTCQIEYLKHLHELVEQDNFIPNSIHDINHTQFFKLPSEHEIDYWYKYTGSVLAIQEQKLALIIKNMVHQAEESVIQVSYTDIFSLINLHNRLTDYLYVLLSLSSGYRPVNEPFGRLSHIDVQTSKFFISDKENKLGSRGRLIYLPDIAIQQINQFIAYLEYQSLVISGLYESLKSIYNDILKSRTGLITYLKFDEVSKKVVPEDTNKTYIFKRISKFINLPLNWYRHFIRSYKLTEVSMYSTSNRFTEDGFGYDVVSAWMGHADDLGYDYFNKYSGLKSSEIRRLSSRVNTILESLNFKTIVLADELPNRLRPRVFENNNIDAIEKRRLNRQTNQKKLEKTVLKLVASKINIDKIKNSEDPQQSFELMWREFDSSLKSHKKFQSYLGYVDGFNKSVQYCQKLFEANNINIGFPQLIVKAKRPKSFRTKDWLFDAQNVADFYIMWVDDLTVAKDITLQEVLLSLVFHSAVLQTPILQQILLDILENKLSLKCIHGLPVITLCIDNMNYGTNTYVSAEAVHQTQVFISPVTAHFIKKFDLTLSNSLNTKGTALSDINTLYRKIKLTKLKRPINETMTLSRFLLSAIHVLEDFIGISLPEYMWYVLIGEEKTHALPISNWQSVIYNVQHTFEGPTSLSTKQQHYDSPHTEDIKKDSHLIVEVNKLFKATGSQHKLSRKSFVEGLTGIYNTLINHGAPLNKIVLVAWLLSKTGNCKVSSIQTYSSTISSRWLVLTEGVILEKLDVDDLEALYKELIELGKTQNTKNSIAKLIDAMHSFMVRNYDFEPIARLAGTTRDHYKVGYVSEPMFKTIFNAVDNLTLTVDELDAIKLSLLLAQRCGLRVGEISKLLLRDISPSITYLEIRNNKLGNNKTSSALRRVHIDKLFTTNDKRVMQRAYLRRKRGKGDALIANNSGVAFDSRNLSKLISDIIKSTTGLKSLSIHHLRHSCLTNIQLMSFLNSNAINSNTHECYQFLESLLPYDKEDYDEIITFFETPIHYKKIFSLAGIAGHANPSTTFKSYIHLTNIQIGLLVLQADLKLPIQQIPILRLPRRKKQLADDQNKVNSYLLKKLRLQPLDKPKYCKKLKFITSQPNLSLSHKPKYSFNDVHQLITAYLEGSDYKALQFAFDVDDEVLQKWLANAKVLLTNSAFKTTKGNPRLLNHNYEGDKIQLLPRKDKFKVNRDEMTRMTNKFRDLYQNSRQKRIRELLKNFLLYTLMNAQYTKNYILFNSVTDLQLYLEVLIKLLPKKYLRLAVYNYESTNSELKEWKRVFKHFKANQVTHRTNEAENHIYKRSIRVQLSITSQTEATKIKSHLDSDNTISQWTVRTVQIFCHYVYIMMGERISTDIIEKE